MSTPFQSPAAMMALRSGLYALRAALLEAANSGNSPAFRKAMQDWYQAADAYIAIVTSDRTFSCRSGCAACCFDNPQAIPAAELVMLESHVDEQMRAQLETDVAIFERIEKAHSDIEARGVAFKKERRPCPLLTVETGRCSVYSIRPLACRDFFAETDSAWCHPDHKDNASVQQLGIEWPVAVTDLLMRISMCLKPEQPQSSLRESLLNRLNALNR